MLLCAMNIRNNFKHVRTANYTHTHTYTYKHPQTSMPSHMAVFMFLMNLLSYCHCDVDVERSLLDYSDAIAIYIAPYTNMNNQFQ